MFKIGDEVDGVADGKTSIRLGKAFLVPHPDETDHFSLFRKLVRVTNDKGTILREEAQEPLGPLAIYRRARDGDRVDIRTSHPTTNEPMALTIVWRPDGRTVGA